MDIQKLFNELHTYQKEEKENNKVITPDFNAFQVLSPKETQLSRFIGELLNRKGVHAQGKIFLDQFIDSFLRKKAFFKNAKSVDVSLEYANKSLDGQIDIFIVFENKFAIAIENKPFADDQERQIMRYCDFMAREYGKDNFLMIYLSADGSNPTDKSLSKDERGKLEKESKFLVLSYPQIRDWVNNCIGILKETGAERLTKLLGEFAEYINLEFRKQNELKNTPMNKALKENIIEAHQLVAFWNDSYKDFKKVYAEKINQLFNEKLPKLVYEDLRNRDVIDNNWEYIKGNFDIDKRHLRGWLIKKKLWKNSGVGVNSNKVIYGNKGKDSRGTNNYFLRGFYPKIDFDAPFTKDNFSKLNKVYCKQTGCSYKEIKYAKIDTWWSEFPENNYQFWGDEHWREVKPNGKTVIYISLFLEKLIKACETDIDEIEGIE